VPLGVSFALKKGEDRRVLGLTTDAEIMSFVEEIEEVWDRAWLYEFDKAWDALHRCLGDGSLTYEASTDRQFAVLAGRPLHVGENYVVSYKTPAETRRGAIALREIDAAWIANRYAALGATDYRDLMSAEDLDYTISWFAALPGFLERVAADNRSMIFTVDQ
jgi:hypothetical protein